MTSIHARKTSVLDSWSAISEKTVFILDRSPYLTHVSSGHSIDGDFVKDSKKNTQAYLNEPTIKPFDRSLWTCSVEAVIGYSRLVWDIFVPKQRCVSILATNANNPDLTNVERISGWQDEEQNLDHLMKSLAKTSHTHQVVAPNKLTATDNISSYPNCKGDSIATINALDQALNELAHLTNAQIESRVLKKSSASSAANVCDNNGRIMLISSFEDDKAIDTIITKFEQMIEKKNESLQDLKSIDAAPTIGLSPINYCDLVIINTFPIQDEGPCSKITESEKFRPYMHCKVYSVKSGKIIAGLLSNLCLQHHNLKSTTITGIPMKEEQNACTSSQYDVEIVHCSSIHDNIINGGSPILESIVEKLDRNGFSCDTLKLSWCTPRSTAVELNHCVATSRITAVDVYSRPSACLTNFLLNGRQVMLEIYKSKSNRMTTHILASHNGELYIHSLATSRQKFNMADPPSINDGFGGKVTDYRMHDFVGFMKQHQLCRSHITDDPLNRTCNLIRRQTLYWPLTIGHTILFNVPQLAGKLLQLIPKDSLSQCDVDECKKAIDHIVTCEKEAQGLPSITLPSLVKSATNKTGTKLDQLYKLLWNELEYYLRVHSTTAEHEAILEYMLEPQSVKKEKTAVKRPAAKTQLASPASPVKKPKTSTQLIPEIHDKALLQQSALFFRTGMSLWQTYMAINHFAQRHKNKLTFVGRLPPQMIQQPMQMQPQMQSNELAP